MRSSVSTVTLQSPPASCAASSAKLRAAEKSFAHDASQGVRDEVGAVRGERGRDELHGDARRSALTPLRTIHLG
jgi:hypothetical protein